MLMVAFIACVSGPDSYAANRIDYTNLVTEAGPIGIRILLSIHLGSRKFLPRQGLERPSLSVRTRCHRRPWARIPVQRDLTEAVLTCKATRCRHSESERVSWSIKLEPQKAMFVDAFTAPNTA